MSGQPPRGRPNPVMMTDGPYSTQGMIAPLNPFTDPSGTLTAVSFRFLFDVFNRIQALEQDVATIQQRLANAGIP